MLNDPASVTDARLTGRLPEEEFAAMAETMATTPEGREQLICFLREEHPVYDQRSTSATVRMRGWVILLLGRVSLPESSLVFVLEELETGTHPYLVAAAARALRAYPKRDAALTRFVMRGFNNIRLHDEPLSLEVYGEYADSIGNSTTSLCELLATLRWLGPHASAAVTELDSYRQQKNLPARLRAELEQTLQAIRTPVTSAERAQGECCRLPVALNGFFRWRAGGTSNAVESAVFEDQDGIRISFRDFFRTRPSIAAFFYTRCDNPLKCSLTVSKLAKVQQLLFARNLGDKIQTAAITYDPAFDIPARLRSFTVARGMRHAQHHRALRTTEGFESLRKHFKLGVNFIESLVNRHRIEIYLLDAKGQIVASFERLHWDEEQVVKRATELLNKDEANSDQKGTPTPPNHNPDSNPDVNTTADAPPIRRASPLLGSIASLAVAFFPKCPLCWSSYLSLFGIASLERIPYAPWLKPVLSGVMLINLTSLWLRARSTGRFGGFCLATAGAISIALATLGWQTFAVWGVILTALGSFLSTLNPSRFTLALRSPPPR